jgi:hypothetical protein
LLIFNKLKIRYLTDTTAEICEKENNSEFVYFDNFFENFYAIKSSENKLKKCYFEIKNCFSRIGLINEAYSAAEQCYNKFQDDIVVMFEMLKQSILVNKILTLSVQIL